MKSWCLEMIKECLCVSSKRLGVPFIAPRQLGAIGGIPGRQFLSSIGWRTGQSGAPPDMLQTWSRWRTGHCPVHTGRSGAPIRPLARPRVTRGLRGRPLARPTVGSPDSPVHHRTVRWILAVRRRRIPESGQLTRHQPGAPDSSVHPNCTESWLFQPSLFPFVFSPILALRQIC
jgi:hypothetical protein